MSTYVSSTTVSICQGDRHCCLSLAILASTLSMMSTVMQLRMRKCVNKFLYTTKGPTYKRRNKTNCNRKPFMPVLQIIRACQYLHPQEDRNDPIQKEYSNLDVETTRHQKPTINSSIKSIQPSPRLNATKRQVTALAIERRLPK